MGLHGLRLRIYKRSKLVKNERTFVMPGGSETGKNIEHEAKRSPESEAIREGTPIFDFRSREIKYRFLLDSS